MTDVSFPVWFLDTFGIPPFQLSTEQRCAILRARIEHLEAAESERRTRGNKYARHPPINWHWAGMYHQEWCGNSFVGYGDCYCSKVIAFEKGYGDD